MLQHPTDQWAAIHASRRADLKAGTATRTWWHEEHYRIDELRAQLVPCGRGLGSRPQTRPVRVWRGMQYKNHPWKAGPRHVALFREKGFNQCQLCGLTKEGPLGIHDYKFPEKWIIALDYLPFYSTGESFTWVDPLWMSGRIRVDPRECHQPEGSPFTVKWLCSECWREITENAYLKVRSYNAHWRAYDDETRPEDERRVVVPGVPDSVFIGDLPDRRKPQGSVVQPSRELELV